MNIGSTLSHHALANSGSTRATWFAIGDGRSLSRQVIGTVRMQITTGELSVGARLPSVWGLAEQLGINPNTVAKAYGQLTAEGWLAAQPGLGLFVAARRQLLDKAERDRRFDDALGNFVNEIVALHYPVDAALKQVETALDPLGARKRA